MGETAQNEIYWLAAVPIAALCGAGLYFVKRRFAGLVLTRAEITRLTPLFFREQPICTEWLHCEYVFRVRGAAVPGACLLPLSTFLEAAPALMIWKDTRHGLPILFYDGERMIGAEAIEHYLLGFRDSLRVRYRTRDPSQNSPIEPERTSRKVTENIDQK